MVGILKTAILLILLLLTTTAVVHALERLKLATTTSTENSGLLQRVLPLFEQEHNCRVDVIAVGTGRALRLGERGEVDILLTHAPEREKLFVANGFGLYRRNIMYNDFVIVGPSSDPANIRNTIDAGLALSKIAASRSLFISRGDDSGTHIKERELWRNVNIEPKRPWYLEAGRGMGEVLLMVSEKQAYTLSDRGTFLALADKLKLEILTQGDKVLYNPYGVIVVNAQRHPHINSSLAEKFAQYLISERFRGLVNNFTKDGQQLFFVAD